MRSNIPFGESYKDPFGFQAKAYYRDGNRALLEPYRVQGAPGAPFEYQGGNTMLLSEMLDRVRDGNLSQDIANGLWEQMGAEHDAFWGLDGDPAEGAVERSFAQFYATTRDFARFGQLLLDTGRVEGPTAHRQGIHDKDDHTSKRARVGAWTRTFTATKFGWAQPTMGCRFL